MRVSLAIAAHNEGDSLAKTVASCVETCAGLDYEIVVADDDSDDGSVEETQHRFPRVRVVKSPRRQGASAAKALGADHARGDVLVFLDGHTKPELGSIARLVEDVEELAGEAVVTPCIPALNTERWTNCTRQVGHGYRLELETLGCGWVSRGEMREVTHRRRKLYESPALIGCVVAVGRTLYDKLWGFDRHMRLWGVEDLDFGLKCWLLGHRILHDPEAAVGHRFRASFDNYSVPAEQVVVNQLRMARKNFTSGVWAEWLDRCRQRNSGPLAEHPEGLWARVWELFQADLASVEAERSYLHAHRTRDEFWYAERFGLDWPRLGGGARAAAAFGPFLPPSPSPPPCSVTILTPGGTFVGAVRDQQTITLEASVSAPIPGPSYAWSVVADPGDGVFLPSNAQTTEFQGTVKGKLTAKVLVTAPIGNCEDTQELVVIEINDLTGLEPQVMDEFYREGTTSGLYQIPYATSDGSLRRVLVGPPEDSIPYQWYTDFAAEVDHLDGKVNLIMFRDGEYIVKTQRIQNEGQPSEIVTEQLLAVYYNSADAEEQPEVAKKAITKTEPKPTADLVLISSSANDNKMLVYAREMYEDEVAIGSVADVVDAINAYTGTKPFTVLIIDHGTKARQSMGDGQKKVAGGYIDNTNATKTDRDAFTDACKANKVSKVTLAGCAVAENTAGEQFLQDLATAGEMTVRAFQLKTYFRKNKTFGRAKAGAWVEKSPP